MRLEKWNQERAAERMIQIAKLVRARAVQLTGCFRDGR